jgi:zinc protease
MKRLVLAVVMTACATGAVRAQPKTEPPLSLPGEEAALLIHPSKMAFPATDFHPVKARRTVRSNGMVVYTLPDHELPLTYVRATIRTGGYLDPDDKLGLAEMCGAVMRTGGTKTQAGDAIDEELEYMAGAVESSIGEENGTVTLNVFSRDLDRGLAIFHDVLTAPAFDAAKLELKRNQMLESIRRRNDQVSSIVQREWRHLVYKGSHQGRISTAATVKAITQADLVGFHQKCYFPNNIILCICGDFDEEPMLTRIDKLFAGWEPRKVAIAPAPQIPLAFAPSLNCIEKEVPQSTIRMGHLGVTRNDPDWHALEVFDSILGGNGFASRLMRQVRSDRGLAYSVASAVTGGRGRGVVLVGAQTKSKSTVETTTLMQSIVKDLRASPVTPDELKTAKESILNSFVFQFTSSYGNVTHQADLEYLGLPADWYDTYQAKIAAVTAQDVLRVAKEHVFPDKFITLIVGKQSEFDKPLKSLGEVNVLPLVDYSK